MTQNTSVEDKIDKWLYSAFGKPLYFLLTFVAWGLTTLGVSAPIAVLLYGIGLWLVRGQWLPYNICQDANYFCPTERFLGLDRIIIWLSGSPLLLTTLVSVLFVAIGFSLGIVIDEMWARSESRYGSEKNPN